MTNKILISSLVLLCILGLMNSCLENEKSYTIAYGSENKIDSVLTDIKGISKIRLIGRDGGYLAWSSDGKKIDFSREYKDSEGNWQGEIWIMNSDGSEQNQIKSLKGSGPFFTPDGRIVFSSEFEDKKSELSIADIDGNNIVHLTNNEANEWHPDVSPDGKHITFMSDRDGNYEIYVMNIDGSDQKRLTNNDVDAWYPSWSPDGSKIIFSLYNDYEEDRHIYIMNRDGTSLKKLIRSGYAVFRR